MSVSMTKGSKMLVFMADQIAYTLNRERPASVHGMNRFDHETDQEWCESMFTIAHCQI